MWNLPIHSETEESAKYVCYFLICPRGRDPPLEVSETQPQNLNEDSFCLECQFMSFFVWIGGIWRGKIPFAKSLSISFSNQRINQLLLIAPQRCCCFFSSRLWWIERCLAWSLLRSLVLQSFGIGLRGPCTTCLGVELFSTATSLSTLRCLRCWIFKKILVGPFSIHFQS